MQYPKYLFISFFICQYAMPALMEQDKPSAEKIKKQGELKCVWEPQQRDETSPRAQADFYIQGVNLRTWGNLLQYEKKSSWAVKKPPHALMAKIQIIEESKKTFGLTPEQSKKLWSTFPEWMFVDILHKFRTSRYRFPVGDITDQPIPVFLSLVMNPVYPDQNAYDFLDDLIIECGVAEKSKSIKKGNKRKITEIAENKRLKRSNSI